MKPEIKRLLTNLITVILAMEIKSFFEKGGGSNDLAYTILKIIFLTFFSVCVINMEDVTRVIIHKMDPKIPEGDLDDTFSVTKFVRMHNRGVNK
jgi:hypothetical protein